ncbi:MAG: Hsp70 family protein [Candidatus Poribacteria bacterium]|nr:Hsp70 family protein [Candidatus Poribacteria bacterium]
MGNCNEKRRYYFGIDLGTTNSVLAYAEVDPDNQETTPISPEIVEINMPGRTNPRAYDTDKLLPSCVYFNRTGQSIVGTHAKGMLKSPHANVVKSIKTKMGTSAPIFGYSPEEISKQVLKALIDGVPGWVFPTDVFPPDEVVIGIPASFEPSMCRATLDAAKKAGIKNPILVHEPIAALHDYRNQQERGLFPVGVIGIEFTDEPKLILVFDLGGGTLDVTLHEVSLSNNGKLSVKELAISRYTSIGGDNFDKLLAKYFLDIHEKGRGGLTNRKQLKPQFQEYAEEAKINLSTHIEMNKLHGVFNPRTTQIGFTSLNRFRRPDGVFNYNLTLCEYEKVIAPLLAHHLTLNSNPMSSASKSSDNIIDPILNVLEKGQQKFGSEETIKPHAVLLNGAMTNLYTVQKRLKTLFQNVPVSPILDPDIAVARGAVIAHYDKYNP